LLLSSQTMIRAIRTGRIELSFRLSRFLCRRLPEIDVTLRRLEPMTDRRPRMPVAFVPHGGGPWPFVDMGLPSDEVAELTRYLRSVRTLPSTPPSALLVVSAHWEETVPTVMTGARPPILYDYYGF